MRLTPLVLIRAALLLVASWSIAAPAGAVPVEELVQVAVHPDAPDVIVARYLNGGDGLLVSRNGGQTFQLACAALVDREEVGQNNPIAVGADGTLFVRSYSGLWRDDRSACSFQRESVFEGLWVSDMVTDPLDGRRMYAVTSGVDGDQLHGLYVREPDGKWSVVGNHEPKLVIHRLRVAATEGGGVIFYESISRVPPSGDLTALQQFVRRSEDGGTHWDEYPVSGGGDAPMLELVDRNNPDRLLLVQDEFGQATRLSISSDGGKTLEPYLELTRFGGAVQAPDGRLWIADRGLRGITTAPAGLWHAASLDEAPRLIDPVAASCLAYRQESDTLLACRYDELGEVSGAQHQFLSKVSFDSVGTLVECQALDAVAVCGAQMCGSYCGATHFPDSAVCENLHDIPGCTHAAQSDGGVGEPDPGMMEPGEKPKKKSDGCSIASAGLPGVHGGSFALLGLALLLARRRRLRLAALLALSACGAEPEADRDVHDTGSDAGTEQVVRCGDDVPAFQLPMSAQGAEGKLSAALLASTPEPPQKYLNDWTLELRDAEGKPVSDATITMARPFMPAHGHDGTFAPTVTAGDAPGRFDVKKLNLWMRGPWEVQLSVSSPTAGDDYIVFQVCIEE